MPSVYFFAQKTLATANFTYNIEGEMMMDIIMLGVLAALIFSFYAFIFVTSRIVGE